MAFGFEGDFGISLLLQNSVMDKILCLKNFLSGFIPAAGVRGLTQWRNDEIAVYTVRDDYRNITGTKV